jgi:hypothetical protein
MSYNLNYTSQFASTETLLNYELNIYTKNYSGPVKDILLGYTPAVQEWQDDDPKKAIKGCTLSVNIINNGIVQLADFYSNEDDTFLVELKRIETDQVLFKGYLLQSDCQEIQVDYYHEIQITATDNLGLLKDITLGQAAVKFGPSNTTYGQFTRGSHQIIFVTYDTPPVINVGSVIKVAGNYYTVNSVTLGTGPGYAAIFGIVEFVPVFTTFMGDLEWSTPVNLESYLTYAQIIALCLKSTQLTLNCKVLSQLYPIGGHFGRWLDDTFVLGTTFKNNNSWDSCYDVLEKIMSRFYASCFQSEGVWYIVRWGELWDRRTSTGAELLGWSYDSEMTYISNITEIKDFYYGEGSDIEAGFLRSILRPYQNVKEKFNYTQPGSVLCNYDLQNLGALKQEFTDGTTLCKDYEIECWTKNRRNLTPGIHYYAAIRVVYNNDSGSDAFGDEIERYIVLRNNDGFFTSDPIESKEFEISRGDIISYSFRLRSKEFYQYQTIIQYHVELFSPSSTLSLDSNGNWGNFGNSHVNYYFLGDNSQEWMDLNITSSPVPFDGLLIVTLPVFPRLNSEFDEFTTYINSISLNVKNQINFATNITGHTHKDSQTASLKNNQSNDIFVDDSPRSTIAGTQFLYSYDGYNRTRTTRWQYQTSAFPDDIRVGEITTFEELFQRYIPRTKYNGKLLNIHQGVDEGYMLSNLAVIKLKLQTDMRYVPGAISIDYKNNTADVTLWEITAVGESYNTLNVLDLYEFKYLYEKS